MFLQIDWLVFRSGGGQGAAAQPAPAAAISVSCLLCRSSAARVAREPAKSSYMGLTFHLGSCFLNKKDKPTKPILLSRSFT